MSVCSGSRLRGAYSAYIPNKRDPGHLFADSQIPGIARCSGAKAWKSYHLILEKSVTPYG